MEYCIVRAAEGDRRYPITLYIAGRSATRSENFSGNYKGTLVMIFAYMSVVLLGLPAKNR